MVDYSYLLGALGGTTPLSTGLPAAARRTQPTPPWTPSQDAPKADALVRSALAGRKLINETGIDLDLKTSSGEDYAKLFALYRGLETLQAMTSRATVKNVAASELALLDKRFTAGMNELSDWLAKADLDGVRLTQGTVAAKSKTTAAVARDSAVSITAPIHEGSPGDVNPAFEGQVRFDITVRTAAATQTIAIDLADMGSAPRSLDAVIAHINGELEAAGVQTRMGRQLVQGETRTMKAGDRTVTLPAGPDRYALAVRGVAGETVGFQATDVSDAVYVVQGVGGGGQQVLKFQDGGAAPAAVARPGETFWVDGRSGQSDLPPGVETVRASAAGPDGSVWLVADLTKGAEGQPIKGDRDVALIKLDSAGRVVTVQALGAADEASGYALSVAADGRVAVAGSVRGALVPGQTGDMAGGVDSFVTVFDSSGQEQWTQRRGVKAADEATAVSFGSDGKVYVAGRAQGSFSGQVSAGGWDGYIQTFSETQVHSLAPVTATRTAAVQFGSAGSDTVSAVAVDGSDLYSAGVENGRLIVRRFSLDAEGVPQPAGSRDLGAANGEVGGLSVANGRIVVTGTTQNPTLDVGGVTTSHQGGTDAFVAVIDTTLLASSADRLTYVGGAGNDTGVAAKVVDGKVWITGVDNRPLDAREAQEAKNGLPARSADPTRAYLARLDIDTGAVEWRRDWAGDGIQARPTTLAVAAGGASALDRLGLPQGEIAQSASKTLVNTTSLRVGDRFYVSPPGGGRAVAVTIDAKDTLQSLARKIELASNRKLMVTVTTEKVPTAQGDGAMPALSAGAQTLTITSRDGVAGGTLTAGESGRDALAGLGLSQGFIGVAAGDKTVTTFGLDLPRTLNLSDKESIAQAGDRLRAAMSVLKSAYRTLAPQSAAARASGPVPEYLQSQIANYQAALQRLGG